MPYGSMHDVRRMKDLRQRRAATYQLVAGVVGGPAATTRALANVEHARAIVLVEGISDEIALDTFAARRGRNLDAEGIAIVPIGGAQAVDRFLARFGPQGSDVRLAGLCDAGEEHVFRRSLERSGFGLELTRADMEELGFCVCVEDLEDELIRAVGPASVEALVGFYGDLTSFRKFQNQPAWRGRSIEAQLRSFMKIPRVQPRKALFVCSEKFKYLPVSSRARQFLCRGAICLVGGDVSARVEQQFRKDSVPYLSGLHQRREFITLFRIDVGASSNQQPAALDATAGGSAV